MQVVAEVYAAQDVVVRPHILLSLVLYKIVDPHQVNILVINILTSQASVSDMSPHQLWQTGKPN